MEAVNLQALPIDAHDAENSMKMSRSIPSKLRIADRAREVASVFVAHGLSDIIAHLNLPGWLRSEAPASSGAAVTAASIGSEDRLCRALEELGPTFVKLGQFLSTRDDLLGPSWTQALARLQGDVAAVPWTEIERQLPEGQGDWKSEHFQSIDKEPLAAGSIAQVHRAVLPDGSRVVLKILRPGIRKVMQADLEVLSFIASFAEQRFETLGFSPREVAQQFRQDRMDEIDLLHEGRSTDRLRRLFRNDSSVVFPEVFWPATTSRVLVLEELIGTPLTHLDIDSLSQSTKSTLVERGSRAVVRQTLEFGFFHADPHPGNLMLLSGDRVGFIDCGIVGYLDTEQRDLLVQLIQAVARGEVGNVQRIATTLAEAPLELAQDRQLRRSLHGLLVDFDQATLGSIDITDLLRRLFAILRQHHAVIPADLIKLVKTLSLLETLATELDPSFSIVEDIAQQTRRLTLGARALRKKALSLAGAYNALFEELPNGLRSLLEQARAQELGIKVSHSGLDRPTAALVFASRLMATAMLVSSLLVAGSIVLLAGQQLPWLQKLGLVAFGCAVVFGGIVMIKHFRYQDPEARFRK